jgi:hypothetical protein
VLRVNLQKAFVYARRFLYTIGKASKATVDRFARFAQRVSELVLFHLSLLSFIVASTTPHIPAMHAQ